MTDVPMDPRVGELLGLVRDNVDELVAQIVVRAQGVYTEAAGRTPVSDEELAVATTTLARVALTALAEQRHPTSDELATAALVGELRARQGVALETLLRVFRVSARVGLDTMQELSRTAGLDATTTITLAATLWDWIDDVSVEVAESHRRVELALARSDQQRRAGFVHGLVRGTLVGARIAEEARAFRVDADAEHLVVRVRPDPEHDADADAMQQLLVPSSWSAGLVAMVDTDVVAILPAGAALPELPVPAGVGPAGTLDATPRSFALAGRALAAAIAYGRTGAQRLDDVGLRAAVLGEDHLGALLVARYITPLRERGAFGDEVLHSLRVYMAEGQNIEAAAKQLIVHPNTLRHRLGRFEEATGADLRSLESLAELWWALTRDDLPN